MLAFTTSASNSRLPLHYHPQHLRALAAVQTQQIHAAGHFPHMQRQLVGLAREKAALKYLTQVAPLQVE